MKQLDLFNTKYTYSHFNGGKHKFNHLRTYDPINKAWHRWVSDKRKHFTPESLSYHDMSKGY
jgi:hypothetical protein